MILLGKAITSVWILINILQFLAYMSMWQIMFSPTTRFTLVEMRKLALAEYIEKLQIGARLSNFIGMDAESDDGVMEKIGLDRLSGGTILNNIGITLILLTAVTLVLIVLLYVLFFVTKCCRCCKLGEKFRKLKEKLYW